MHNADCLRRYLVGAGAFLERDFTFRDGKFYDVVKGRRLKAGEAAQAYTPEEYEFGRENLRERPADFLERTRRRLAAVEEYLKEERLGEESRAQLLERKNDWKECSAMKLNEIYALLDAAAPRALSDEYCAKYGAYDNSGVLVDTGADIGKSSFPRSVRGGDAGSGKAGANLIVTHHPAIYSKIGNIRIGDPLGAKLAACLKKAFPSSPCTSILTRRREESTIA